MLGAIPMRPAWEFFQLAKQKADERLVNDLLSLEHRHQRDGPNLARGSAPPCKQIVTKLERLVCPKSSIL